MTLIKHFPALQVLLPFFGALFSILTFRYRLATRIIAVISIALSLFLSIYGLSVINKEAVSYNFGDWHAPIGIEYRLDYLNQPIIIYINCVLLFFLIFCNKLVTNTILRFLDRKRQSLFYAVLLFAHSGYLGIVSTNDLFNLYVFIEISSLSSYVLMAQGNNPRAVIGAFDYLMLGTVGATLILIGIGFLLSSTGSLNMLDVSDILQNSTSAGNLDVAPVLESSRTLEYAPVLRSVAPLNSSAEANFARYLMLLKTHYDSKIVMLGISFFLIGSILKTAFFPMHFWMIRTYSSAAPVILTYLASISSIIGIYIILRFIHFTIDYNVIIKYLSNFISLIALATIILCTYFACRSQRVRNIVIYSSAVQIGYMFLLLVIPRGESLLFPFLFADSLNKIALFLLIAYSDISKPFSMLWRILVVFSLIYSCGLPISSMFFIKISIFELLIVENMWLEFVIVVISSAMSLLYHYKIAKKLCWDHYDYTQLKSNTKYCGLIFISIMQFFLPIFLPFLGVMKTI
ncbi:proton-conducting transporter membrane subunit [Candidatus Tisiphia endosymbiont of Myopa tessellatipennis]|uniref:proton-conducting transporter transmembrane domain-containing protein n=1 Tax=Candidatus Tisiphia endosymbiont of Myopa tessellatipennis TaxID=3066257 RepID=UPI0039777170